MRSGSGGSRTTATSDSGDFEGGNLTIAGSSTLSASSSSPSQTSPYSNGYSHAFGSSGNIPSASSTGTFSVPSPGSSMAPLVANAAAALTPIATRMRERDADAMEKYMRRNRSGSASTDTKSQNGSSLSSAGPSDDITSLSSSHASGTSTPRKVLRPSVSAAQLQSSKNKPPSVSTTPSDFFRSRSGTNPTAAKPTLISLVPTPILTRSSSNASDSRVLIEEPDEMVVGPSIQYAKLAEPLSSRPDSPSLPATQTGRRLPFNLLSKTLGSTEGGTHRRGVSATSIR